jgi:uncharacterized Zn-binding protein involved in type VI secretion
VTETAPLRVTTWVREEVAVDTTRARSRRRCWALAATAVAAAGMTATGMAGAQAPAPTDDVAPWVLESVEVEPPVSDPGWVVVTSTQGTVTLDFVVDPTASVFVSYSSPPDVLEPGSTYTIPVTVTGAVTGGTDTQGYRLVEVLLWENGRQSYGAGAVVAELGCTTHIGTWETTCSEPVNRQGELTFVAPLSSYFSSQGTYRVSVFVFGRAWAHFDYRQETTPPAVEPIVPPPGDVAPGDVAPGDVVPGEVAPGDVVPGDVGGFDEGSSSNDAVLVVVVAAAAVAALVGGAHLTKARRPRESGDEDDERRTTVELDLTCPVGISPRVFTAGWLFGARCVASGRTGVRDLSSAVRWSGSGTFQPSVGPLSRPYFHREGPNTIELAVTADGREVRRTFTVNAVSPRGFAAATDVSHCPSDAHGCPACPHATKGPIITGSLTVMIGAHPAARVGDRGIAAACCDGNTFQVAEGDPTVLIDGRPAARRGSLTAHCGGSGRIISSKGDAVWQPR